MHPGHGDLAKIPITINFIETSFSINFKKLKTFPITLSFSCAKIQYKLYKTHTS